MMQYSVVRVPLYAAEHLSVAEDLAKVDVEHVTGLLDHDVVVMAITYAEDVGSNAVPGTGTSEVINSL